MPATSAAETLACSSGLDHGLRVAPDLRRIVLHPARFGKDLLVLELTAGDDLAAVVEDDGPRTGCALIDGDDVHDVVLSRVVTAMSVSTTA